LRPAKYYLSTLVPDNCSRRTGEDGRVPWVSPNFSLREGTYKLVFGVEEYYRKKDLECFYPYVEIVFKVNNATQHYHIPLTLSPFAYSTYRGS
ncbi:putative hydroxyisourate hydrolase, partial [Ancylostoma caninum]